MHYNLHTTDANDPPLSARSYYLQYTDPGSYSHLIRTILDVHVPHSDHTSGRAYNGIIQISLLLSLTLYLLLRLQLPTYIVLMLIIGNFYYFFISFLKKIFNSN